MARYPHIHVHYQALTTWYIILPPSLLDSVPTSQVSIASFSRRCHALSYCVFFPLNIHPLTPIRLNSPRIPPLPGSADLLDLRAL